jgi:predicted PurR-regulated permease PerM
MDKVPPPPAALPAKVDEKKSAPSFLAWLPWEKITIWGLFLLAVYTLRHFFFIIFMTFIVAYIMRGIVQRIARVLSPRRERAWLERILAVICFALLLFGGYEVGSFLGPTIKTQAEALFGRVTNLDPQREFNTILNKTVGAFLFSREFGDRNDLRYQTEFVNWQEQGPRRVRAFQEFPGLVASVEGAFSEAFKEDERRRIAARMTATPIEPQDLESWFLEKRAPEIYDAHREAYRDKWEALYVEIADENSLKAFKQNPDWEMVRDGRILKTIWREKVVEAKSYSKYEEEYRVYLVESLLEEARSSPAFQERFREYYEKQRQANPRGYEYDFDKYLELKAAYRLGEKAFSEALGQPDNLSEEQRLDLMRGDFQLEKQEELANQWWTEGPTALHIKNTLSKWATDAASVIAGWIRDGIKYLITIPIQLALSLLLSFFITFDVPKLRKGIDKLKESRARDFYNEIAPGLISFGRLIGRAFQAQGLIALFNTLLTFLAITFLGIQNEVFLCAIVFVCSFIPVLGVVLSSVPIAIIAIVQPGGSLWLAIQVIAAILVIHFLETSILNPKILGDMLHLHPVLVLAILAVGEHFFGIWGLLLGVPVMVYIIRFVILDEGIPGLIEPVRAGAPPAAPAERPPAASPAVEGAAAAPPERRPAPAPLPAGERPSYAAVGSVTAVGAADPGREGPGGG